MRFFCPDPMMVPSKDIVGFCFSKIGTRAIYRASGRQNASCKGVVNIFRSAAR
jgi:hypothetical protein